MAGMLYLVPTPIGNLGDISTRCRETLEQADFIAAEDTRVTVKLLNHLGIKKSLVSYYEHNKAFKGNVILDRILAGETCALVSDAGSPAISDPGEELVKQCAEAGITVCAIPGPCAIKALTRATASAAVAASFACKGAPAMTRTNSPLGGFSVYLSTASPRVVRTTSSWSLVSSLQRLMGRSAPKMSAMSSKVATSLWGAS